LVEIAQELASRGHRNILFVVAGDMTLHGSLPGELGRYARLGGTFSDYVSRCGVGDMFLFLGHIAAPENVLDACDLLLKPSRDNAPWSRDVLEALAMGRPVISIGQYQRFVETGKTGFLLPQYSPGAIADLLLRLDVDRELARQLGLAAANRVAQLCDGPGRAGDLLNIWRDAIHSRRGQKAA
jgi:glycosyltransferase involved in cell wall biosynthesis